MMSRTSSDGRTLRHSLDSCFPRSAVRFIPLVNCVIVGVKRLGQGREDPCPRSRR